MKIEEFVSREYYWEHYIMFHLRSVKFGIETALSEWLSVLRSVSYLSLKRKVVTFLWFRLRW